MEIFNENTALFFFLSVIPVSMSGSIQVVAIRGLFSRCSPKTFLLILFHFVCFEKNQLADRITPQKRHREIIQTNWGWTTPDPNIFQNVQTLSC